MSETLHGVNSMSAELKDSQELPITHKSESQEDTDAEPARHREMSVMETVVNHGENGSRDHGENGYKDQNLSEASQKTKTPRKRSKGAKTGTPLKKVVVCFDVGSSLNKILYQVEGQDVQYMVMEPEHLALPAESSASLPMDSGMGRPEDNAWIRFKKGEKCHAVGRVADDFKASVNLKTLKWEIATPKILGAIGAIAEREGLGSQFRLDLGVLLPFGEITSTEQLESELKSSLRGFYFRHQRLKVKLERYKCVPEGSGLAMWTGMNDRSAFTRKNVAFLMFGHRNTSSLFFRKGTLCRQLCSTTELGFYDLIDKMGHKVAGLSRNDVLRAIKTEHNGYWKQGSWPKKIASEINWSVITQYCSVNKFIC
ncbi:MAG: ParM/StbA family protein [Crocosphaera sp.]|nr:ParM/StbA family protein [Crocosphaera sp.]